MTLRIYNAKRRKEVLGGEEEETNTMDKQGSVGQEKRGSLHSLLPLRLEQSRDLYPVAIQITPF
ncbi:hypothetical protein BDW66DRAFT_25955 [Aspergillus desertorum]